MIHTFKEDFYGEILSVVMVGYIRPEKSFDSLGKLSIALKQAHAHTFKIVTISCYFYPFLCILHLCCRHTEALIAAITTDIEEAKVKLELPEHLKLKEDNFFTSAPSSSPSVASGTKSTSSTILNGH